jgi:hypothetical protein
MTPAALLVTAQADGLRDCGASSGFQWLAACARCA